MKRFVFLTDLHYGYERDSYRHKRPLHDPKAMSLALQFVKDYKPDVLVLGGDILDCGAITPHAKGKPGRTEGLRLLADGQECQREFFAPLSKIPIKERYFITGNHEFWLDRLVDEMPGLESLVDIRNLLQLQDYTIIPQGGYVNLGRLTFIHGDQLRGGEHAAKQAVIDYERSVRFGHFHTAQMFTKASAIDTTQMRTGVAVPCLCHRSPQYGKNRPNKWCQGLLYGVVLPDGTFFDQLAIVVKNKLWANGKMYRG